MNVFTRRIAGFRLIDLVGITVLTAVIVGVYLAKTVAGAERAEVARVESQIRDERARIRLLQAEIAFLEKPARLERLAVTYLGMEPVGANREVTLDQVLDAIYAGPPGPAPSPSAVATMVNGAGSGLTVPPPEPGPPPQSGQ